MAANANTAANTAATTELVQAQFRKTTLCRYHATGGCWKGASCKFAHGKQDMLVRPSLRKTKLCPAWLENKCPCCAEACEFAHGWTDIHTTPAFLELSRTRKVNNKGPAGMNGVTCNDSSHNNGNGSGSSGGACHAYGNQEIQEVQAQMFQTQAQAQSQPTTRRTRYGKKERGGFPCEMMAAAEAPVPPALELRSPPKSRFSVTNLPFSRMHDAAPTPTNKVDPANKQINYGDATCPSVHPALATCSNQVLDLAPLMQMIMIPQQLARSSPAQQKLMELQPQRACGNGGMQVPCVYLAMVPASMVSQSRPPQSMQGATLEHLFEPSSLEALLQSSLPEVYED